MGVITFDGAARLILLDGTGFDAAEIYSEWKRWVQTGAGAGFAPAFRTIGGDPLGGSLLAGAYFFLRNDLHWRVRPMEADHELVIDGNLYAEDASQAAFVPVLGDFTVTIRLNTSSLTQQTQLADISEIAAILGLDPGRPVTFTPAQITAGNIVQTLTGDGENSTTVTRQ